MQARTLGLAAAICVFSQSALADGTAAGSQRIAVGSFFGGNFLDDDVELGNSFYMDQVPESAFLLGLRASYDVVTFAPRSLVAPTLSLELEGKLAFSSVAGNPIRDREDSFSPVFGLRAHAMLAFLPSEVVSPFVLVGGGAETVVVDSIFIDSPDTDAAFHWGAGARHMLTPQVSLRADYRQVVTAGRDDFLSLNHEIQIGAGYHWGADQPPAPVPSRDSDGDGLVDEMDSCPDAPEDLDRFEDGDGCPDEDNDADGFADALDKCPLEAEVENGIEDDDGCPEHDGDGDGIFGSADACPDEAEDRDGFEDQDGCPDADNDQDGLADAFDKCPAEPETSNGFQDEDGCPDEVPAEVAKFTGSIKGIRFKLGSSKILGSSFKVLDGAVAVMTQYPALRIEISGHTDSTGQRERNLMLSAARAAAVKKYLVSKGIADDRVETVGHGPDKPVADNATRAGRAENRRIEFRLLGAAAPPPAQPPSEPAPPAEP